MRDRVMMGFMSSEHIDLYLYGFECPSSVTVGTALHYSLYFAMAMSIIKAVIYLLL
jgi:hypothetical protein